MNSTTRFTRPTETNRLTTAPYATDILRLYRWKAIDPSDGVAVASLRGDAPASGRMLDQLIYNAFTRGRIAATDLIIIDDHDAGEIDRFVFGDRCPTA